MTVKPKVTCVINTVNEKTDILRDCILSYLNQEGVEVELLVSTLEDDVSIEIARKCGVPNQNIIINPVKGIYIQYNFATQYMTGEWYMYGSGNDTMLPRKLITEYEKCIETGAKICYSAFNTIVRDAGGKVTSQRITRFPEYNYAHHINYFGGGGNFVNDCSLVHRSIMEKYMPLRVELWDNYSQYDFWLRVREGEKTDKVFCYNNTPTWNYNLWQDSKHVKRMNNPAEKARYESVCRAMLSSHLTESHNPLPASPFKFLSVNERPNPCDGTTMVAECGENPGSENKPYLTIGIPSLNSKGISWLAMESLCRQIDPKCKFEVIICEEQNPNATGKTEFLKYYERLSKIGCVKILYLPLSVQITLSEKWRYMAQYISDSSQGFVLWSCDCYSYHFRLIHTRQAIEAGADWTHKETGVFYHINTGKSILYNGKQIKEEATHLAMAWKSNYMRHLPNESLKSGIDSWLYHNFKKMAKDGKMIVHILPAVAGQGIDCHGINNISTWREKHFDQPGHCFEKTTLTIDDCVPEDIALRLKAILEPAKYEQQANIEVQKTEASMNDIFSGRISQCRVADSVEFFGPGFMKKYGLRQYYNPDQPAIFFGCYGPGDYEAILSHKALAIIIWAGSDTGTHQVKRITWLQKLNKPNIRHVSGSRWCSDDLKEAGLKFIYLPISVNDNEAERETIKAHPLGKKVYIYTAESSEAHMEFYGKSMYDKLINELGRENFIVCSKSTYTREKLIEAYKQCCVGLRLVQHDGLSETVCELGLLGRKVIYNGIEPNSLHYQNYNDVKSLVKQEMARAGQTDELLANSMKDFLSVGKFWLNLEFWNSF